MTNTAPQPSKFRKTPSVGTRLQMVSSSRVRPVVVVDRLPKSVMVRPLDRPADLPVTRTTDLAFTLRKDGTLLDPGAKMGDHRMFLALPPV